MSELEAAERAIVLKRKQAGSGNKEFTGGYEPAPRSVQVRLMPRLHAASSSTSTSYTCMQDVIARHAFSRAVKIAP